jgi:hypothetical protein
VRSDLEGEGHWRGRSNSVLEGEGSGGQAKMSMLGYSYTILRMSFFQITRFFFCLTLPLNVTDRNRTRQVKNGGE